MFDEGPRPDMVIQTRGAILGRTKVTSRAGDEDAKVAVDLQASHRSFCRSHSGTLNESTNVGIKTGGSRVGGPNCASRPDGNRRQGTLCFTQVRALSMEVKPYSYLINIDDMGSTRVDLARDRRG